VYRPDRWRAEWSRRGDAVMSTIDVVASEAALNAAIQQFDNATAPGAYTIDIAGTITENTVVCWMRVAPLPQPIPQGEGEENHGPRCRPQDV
jgi:hypothetical protein